jgi:iron complex outermembrane receptor protein
MIVHARLSIIAIMLSGMSSTVAPAQTAAGGNANAATTLPEIQVIAPSPLAGPGIDVNKTPSMIETLSADDVARTFSLSATEALAQRVPGVSLRDVQGNGFMQDLHYRGFAASPLPGAPQGIAVYLNGMRVNEAFGDTVNWDFIPTSAIQRADIWTSNPVFGLNALGGAVNIQMKNGFGYRGWEAEVQGGSYGRLSGAIQYGGRKDDLAVYIAAEGLKNNGWRYESPARIQRLYSDLGWKGDQSEIHLITGVASNFFGIVGPTPVELLNRDYKSIYTWPQTTRNEMGFIALNGKFDLANDWSLQSNLYARKFRQRHVDGNDADVEECAGMLCLSNAGFSILDSTNNPIAFAGATTPYGTVDRTSTEAQTIGASLQLTNNAKLFNRGNYFTVGGSIDHSWIDFSANSALGYIFPNLFVGPNSLVPGTGSIIHTAANLGYSPVTLRAQNNYYGLYVRDTFDVTVRLSATIGARMNIAQINMSDLLGTSPDLNGNYIYSRVNPLAGLTYKLIPDLTAYAGYSEANRAPTPLELGCANPLKPCLLEGFLVSDPPLNQVVSRTYEAGLRGNTPIDRGRIEWKFGLFRTDSINDIINVASAVQGRGVFQNVDATRRQGAEANAQIQSDRWLVYASYSYIDATYQFSGDIASPNNPSADQNGNVHVVPGKRIPGIPQHQFKASTEFAVTPAWKIGGNVVAVGSQYYVGDNANQNEKLPAYWIANLYSSYEITKSAQLFGVVNNLFNKRYSTYGTYFEPQSIMNAIANPPTNHQTQTPAQPLSVYMGLRVKL